MSKPFIKIEPDSDRKKGVVTINGRFEDLPKLKKLVKKYINPNLRTEIQDLNNEK